MDYKRVKYQRIFEILGNWSAIGDQATVSLESLGATNEVYQVADESTYYLKKYKTPDLAKVQREHQLLIKLSEVIEPVIAPIVCNNNSTILTNNGKYFALFPSAKGKLIPTDELTAVHAYEAGAALARLHQALAHFDTNDFPKIKLEWNQNTWVSRLRKLTTIISSLKNVGTTEGWALKRSSQQKEYLASSDSIHAYIPESPRGLIHGDYHHYNVFFDSHNKVSGIIDWDQVQKMPLGYEVARSCMYMFQMDITKSVTFVNGYLSILALKKDELTDGVRAWGVYADHHVWALEEAYINDNAAAKKFIPYADFEPFMVRWAPIETALFEIGK